METSVYTVYSAGTGRIFGCTTSTIAPILADGQAMIPVGSNPRTQRVNISDPLNPVVEDIPPYVPTLAELKEEAKGVLANRRWDIEVGGMPFNGSTIATDDRSKLLLASAAAKARDDAEFTTKWKTADGEWIELNVAAIGAIYTAVFDWVSACFAREEELTNLIDSAADAEELATLTASIEPFWPDA